MVIVTWKFQYTGNGYLPCNGYVPCQPAHLSPHELAERIKVEQLITYFTLLGNYENTPTNQQTDQDKINGLI